MFEAKYLWKFLSISGKTYIIRIVSSRRIFEKKNGDHVMCTLNFLQTHKHFTRYFSAGRNHYENIVYSVIGIWNTFPRLVSFVMESFKISRPKPIRVARVIRVVYIRVIRVEYMFSTKNLFLLCCLLFTC